MKEFGIILVYWSGMIIGHAIANTDRPLLWKFVAAFLLYCIGLGIVITN